MVMVVPTRMSLARSRASSLSKGLITVVLSVFILEREDIGCGYPFLTFVSLFYRL